MRKHGIWIIFLGLIVGGCASDGGKMESSNASPSTTAGSSTANNPSMATSETTAPGSTMSARTPSESNATIQSGSTQNRIAAGVEEETLDSCVARIPQNATAGQRMLAEQTCRRDFSRR